MIAAAALRPRRSMTVRLLVLVVSVILLVEGLLFLANIERERSRWMAETLRDTQIAAVALAESGGAVSPEARATLMRLSRAQAIRLLLPDGPRTVLAPTNPLPPVAVYDLDRETWLQGFARALGGLVRPNDRRLEIIGTGPLGTRLDLMVTQASLARFLRLFALRFAAVAGIVAVVTGALLFVALRGLLVLPLRRITSNIMAFRHDPEQGAPLDMRQVSFVRDDEIAMVGQQLAALQVELRTALWRNARLAAVGTAVAKMSHDLRGILSSALLVADRLTMSKEAPVRQAGEVIVRAVHRATALAQDTLNFVREGPPPLERTDVALAALINEAASAVAELGRPLTVRHNVPADATINVDTDSLLRVLTNLFRNAAQAGARIVDVTATGAEAATVLHLRDDGPGLPGGVQQTLFRPFAASGSGGTGLGLAIARDLMRAHGGDLTLADTSPSGTCFTLYLQQPRREE